MAPDCRAISSHLFICRSKGAEGGRVKEAATKKQEARSNEEQTHKIAPTANAMRSSRNSLTRDP